VNPESAFPREIVYERVGVDRLRFVVAGVREGKNVEWQIEVDRAERNPDRPGRGIAREP
jgi:hypothetical protein